MWGVGVTGGGGWLYNSTICGVWVSLGMIIYLHYMWGVSVTGDDYIPPLYVGSKCHCGWLYTSNMFGVYTCVTGGRLYIYPCYLWSLGGKNKIHGLKHIETHCWQHSALTDVCCECHWGWLYSSTICGVWVSLGGGGDYIPPLYVGRGCHWGGGDDYIPPLYVGCECHWGMIIYLHYMWGVSVTGG